MKKTYRIKLSRIAHHKLQERNAVLYTRALERWNRRTPIA